ncbi:hypothetical protein Vretimale_579 [Volvox reticuliferus]|uniref:Regulator of telomere elongation helicase 1 homolog n=1 Tax=Volvox reticuliferus TaxID=1737510 RepID=A0A8J4G149_9CHLO|nr:hypothetical protein Vretimale_579 [Volvox reticuliferus]
MEQLSAQTALAKPERKVTTLQIAGIPVEFPFEPYPCQGKNALLESPTGTGKTLCLLCSTLAWRESLKPPAPDLAGPAAAALAQQAGLGFSATLGLPGTAAAAAASLIASGAAGPTVAQAGGSGSGNGGKPALPLIIYSSRTHSQLAQVMKELRNSSYKDRVRSTVLSSRQQTCLHPTASKLSSGAANQACKALTTAKKCSWHNQLKFGKYRNAASSLVSSVPDIEELMAVGKAHGVCPFYLGRDAGKEADIVFLPYNYLLDPSTRRTMTDNIDWGNAVVIFDEAHNVESVSSDSCSFDITAKQLTDAMLEAKRCKEACLERIERGAVALVDVPAPGEAQGLDYRRMAADMDLLQGVLKLIENGLHSLAAKLPPPPPSGHGGDGGGLTRPGSFLFEFLGQLGITAHSLSALNAAIDAAAEILAAADVEAGRSSNKASTVALQHLQSCLNLAFSTLEPLTDKPGAPPAHKGFRVHVHLQRSWGADKLPAPTLSYWCFIPGMAFRRLAALRLRSFLLTSGTLSPMDSFAAELQIPFPVRLENPHVIAANQVWVGVLPTGPSGAALNSTYASRDSIAYKDELGNALVNVARLVPDGLLVFFASYAAMDSAINHWKQNGGAGGVGSTWERIVRHKAPVVEPRESSAFGAAIEEFRAKLDDPATQGAVFFAVCRGKVSEGLDFSDRAGRAVVITGIPYAVKNDAKVRLKRDVLDEEARAISSGANGLAGEGVAPLTGEAWYTNTAMRAVNQAMGRVIRHRWDYGAILLADDRFRTPATQRNMSRWVREHVVVYEHFGKASASLTKFFKDKANFQKPSRTLPGRSTNLSAFETVGVTNGQSSLAAVAATAALGSGSSGGAAGQSLLDSVPAAIDVSGIGALAATGLGGIGSRKPASTVGPSMAGGGHGSGSGSAGGGGGGLGRGSAVGLLGLLRSAPAAADATDSVQVAVARSGIAAGNRNTNGSDGGGASAGGGGIGLTAALDCLGGSRAGAHQAAAAVGRELPPPWPAASAGVGNAAGSFGLPLERPFSSASGSGPTRGGVLIRRNMLALAGGAPPVAQQLAPLGHCSSSGGGSGAPAMEVVGPQHKLAELRRRVALGKDDDSSKSREQSPEHKRDVGPIIADVDRDPVADLLQEDDRSGVAAGRTAGGLTRIVLQSVEPAAAGTGSAAASGGTGSGGGDSSSASGRCSCVPPGAARGNTTALGSEVGASTSGHHIGSAADGSGGGGEGGGAPARADPKVFMTQLKSELSSQGFKDFQRLMTAYKTSKDLHAFVDGVVALLRGPSTCHLLRGVAAFMPKTEREWFNNIIAVHMRAAAAHAALVGATTTEAMAPPAVSSASAGNIEILGARGQTSNAAAAEAARMAAAGVGPSTAGGTSSALGKHPAPSDAADKARPGQQQQRNPNRVVQPAAGANLHLQPQSQPSANQVRTACAAAMNAALAATSASQLGSQLLSRPHAQPSQHPESTGRGESITAMASLSVTSHGHVHAQQNQKRQKPPGYIGAYDGSSEPALPPSKRQNLGPAPSGATTDGGRRSGPTTAATSAAAAAGPPGAGVLSAAAAAVPCSLCGKRPMSNAHEGPCGHLACYNCWLVQLAVHFKCKTCGRSMRQKNLTKKYFM